MKSVPKWSTDVLQNNLFCEENYIYEVILVLVNEMDGLLDLYLSLSSFKTFSRYF